MTHSLLQPTHTVRHLKNVLIPVRDGVRIAADLFMPEAGAGGPFPAVFEFLPYRKDDRTAARWNAHHYFAERGFVGLRADLRGTGGSEGCALDEYTLQEQLDAGDVIDWASRQPWCNGSVGMFGTSYGGFNCIQTAMHRPPALKAIIPHAATDDRYHDDVHYSGGCLMAIDQVLYPGWMVPMNAMPPYPQYTTADWAGVWRTHLEGNPPWVIEWLRHQTEDDFWLQGSLKTDYAAIQCPVLHLGGWADGYTNPVFRMAQHLRVPNRAIVGPWQHSRPLDAYPGPRINHLHEMVRWWAHWLRGDDTGVMDEPQLAVYVQHGARPDPFLPHMPGEWRYEPTWPPERLAERPLYFAAHGELRAEPAANTASDQFEYRATVGTTNGFWFPVGPPFGLPRDQAPDDAKSLTFTTAPLEAPLELLGFPKVNLHAASTASVVFFAVRLCDVAPDGTSTLVSRGILNATHRHSHRDPSPVIPGEVMELEIPLKVTSWVFQPGHRLRVSVAGADWPTVWPSPYPATNTVYHGRVRPSRIILPVVSEPAGNMARPVFQPAVSLPSRATTSSAAPLWQVREDVLTGQVTVHVREQHRVQPVGEPFEVEEEQQVETGTSDARPAQSVARSLQRISMRGPEGQTDLHGRVSLRSTSEHIHVDIGLRVLRDGEPFFDRQWLESIPRHLT